MKYKVGDVVVVKNEGDTYSTYADMFVKMGFNCVLHNPSVPNGTLGKIFATDVHDSDNDVNLYGIITEAGNEVLIGERGIELFHTHSFPEKKVIQRQTYHYHNLVVTFYEGDGVKIDDKFVGKGHLRDFINDCIKKKIITKNEIRDRD